MVDNLAFVCVCVCPYLPCCPVAWYLDLLGASAWTDREAGPASTNYYTHHLYQVHLHLFTRLFSNRWYYRQNLCFSSFQCKVFFDSTGIYNLVIFLEIIIIMCFNYGVNGEFPLKEVLNFNSSIYSIYSLLIYYWKNYCPDMLYCMFACRHITFLACCMVYFPYN